VDIKTEYMDKIEVDMVRISCLGCFLLVGYSQRELFEGKAITPIVIPN